jgi:Trans-aconitate methyltransferase|nr:trans-aconitate 2-methyltransferase [Pseudonocardia thermophila]
MRVVTTWDPAAYLTFDDHRSRPFYDLIARIGAQMPRRVVDLGCGPGHLTPVLARRWPDAEIVALDASPEMVAAARERGIAAELADAADWEPGPADDVVVTNAVLQWVPQHRELLPRWIAALPAGGWFAMQVPGNFAAPSHALVRELAAEPRWAGRVTLRGTEAVAEPTEYAELIAGAGARADVWETTYLQRLTGSDPVLRWIEGTALRPVRDALDEDAYAAFTAELAPRLRAAYPPRPDGSTWFPFRRIFAVAHRLD